MPGVMMIETMAQAAGYLLLARNGASAMPVLAAVDGVRFRALAHPGEDLTAQARMRHDGSGYAVLETRLACGERALTEAVLRLRVLPFFNEEMRSHIVALASRHGLTASAPPPRELHPGRPRGRPATAPPPPGPRPPSRGRSSRPAPPTPRPPAPPRAGRDRGRRARGQRRARAGRISRGGGALAVNPCRLASATMC